MEYSRGKSICLVSVRPEFKPQDHEKKKKEETIKEKAKAIWGKERYILNTSREF
jgi:hypothetical protein